jgi:hypothetical protein
MVARLRRARPPQATLLCIYRDKYRVNTIEMVGRAEASGWAVRLWALDEPAPELAGRGVGQGAGGRFAILNRLAAGVDEHDWLVISDDDALIVPPWTLATFLTVCDRLGFDLAQPAHVPGSYHAFEFLGQHAGVLARDTTFVESGPIVAISPSLRPRIVPFLQSTEMGWGADILWTDLIADGYRLGVVDGIPLRHLAQMGSNYDIGPEMARIQMLLADRGLTFMGELMHTRHTYRWLPFRRVRSVLSR